MAEAGAAPMITFQVHGISEVHLRSHTSKVLSLQLRGIDYAGNAFEVEIDLFSKDSAELADMLRRAALHCEFLWPETSPPIDDEIPF